MPQAVIHILVPLILAALFKDWYEARDKKQKFPLHYVLIAGIAGLFPDLDIAAFWILNFFGFTLDQIHRTFLHTLFIPLLFVILFFAFQNVKVKQIRKHKIKLNVVFLMIAFGSIVHLILDSIFIGLITPLYPVLTFSIGLDLISYLPPPLDILFIPSLEAVLLVLWLIYLELKHKISDFI